jgi:VanZ family protein
MSPSSSLSLLRDRFRPIRLRFIAAGVYWISLLVATHLPPKDLPKTHVNDKFEHFGAYGLLTALLAACLWKSKLRPVSFFFTLIAIVWTYGVFDERTQPIFGRTCDLKDWYADASATAVVAFLATVIRR